MQTKKDRNSAWSLLGGEWPSDMKGASGEKRLAYALLRGALETLVLKRDGHMQHPDIDGLSIADDYWNARGWLLNDNFETEYLSLDFVCDTVGIEKKDLRSLIKGAGI